MDVYTNIYIYTFQRIFMHMNTYAPPHRARVPDRTMPGGALSAPPRLRRYRGHIHIHANKFTHIHPYIYIYIYVCKYAYVSIYTYTYMYVYEYIPAPSSGMCARTHPSRRTSRSAASPASK